MSFTPNIRIWSCPVTMEVFGSVVLYTYQYVDQGDGTGALQLSNGNYLTIEQNGTYGQSNTVVNKAKFKVVKPNFLEVTSDEDVTFRIPYFGL